MKSFMKSAFINPSIGNKVPNYLLKEVNPETTSTLTREFSSIIETARKNASGGALDLGYTQKLFKDLCSKEGVDPNRFWNIYQNVIYKF